MNDQLSQGSDETSSPIALLLAKKPPLKEIRGQEYPDPNDLEGVKTRFINKLVEQTNGDALARFRQATRNILYANGRQWITWNARHKMWDEFPNEPNEVRVTVNYIKPILRSRAQRLLSPKVQFSAIPDSNSFESRDRAKLATRFLHNRWRQLAMDSKVADALEMTFCAGVSALKSFWNPNIGPLRAAKMQFEVPGQEQQAPDGQIIQGPPQMQETFVDATGNPVETEEEAYHYRPGDTDTAIRTVFNVRLNPEARGWTAGDGLRWLIDEDVVPLSVAKATWPEYAAKIQAAPAITSLTYERMSAGSSTNRGASPGGSPYTQGAGGSNRDESTTIREYWELPDDTYFPAGRLITMVGECIVYDGPFPQGVFPYSPMVDEPAVLSPYGRSSVNDTISPQDMINRENTSIVQEMWLAGKGQFVAWQIPGLMDQITSETGAILKIPMRTNLQGRSINDVFQRLEPARVPPDRYRIIEMAKQAIYEVGAFHEVTRGTVPPGLDSGVAIQHLLEQEAGQLMRAMRALKNTYLQWARHQLSIARWGYAEDDDRWIPMDRPDMAVMLTGVNGAKLPDPDMIDLDIENFRPTSEAEQRNEVMDLMTQKLLPPQDGLRYLDMGRGLSAALQSETRHYTKALFENELIMQGQVQMVAGPPQIDQMTGMEMPGAPQMVGPDGMPMLLPQDDDPAIHMMTLDEILLDPTIPPQIRQLALAHKDEHRQALQALMPPAPPEGEGAPPAEGEQPPA